MDGEQEPTKDALPEEGQPSSSAVSPSEIQGESFTRAQLETLIAQKHSTLDKQISSLEKDLKESKSTVASKEAELADISEERERLHSEIDDLASNDPKKFDIVKKDRELRERERNLRADTLALQTEKRIHGERIKKAEDHLREITINEIAAKYDNGEPSKLKRLCDLSGVTSEEHITEVAETLWSKKATGTLVPLSGRTSGGGIDFSSLSPKEKIEEGIKQKTK